MHEPMRSPCARLVLLMHSLERADNWRSIIGNYTQQHSVCSILIIWNNINISMPEVLRSALGDKTRVIAARQNSLTNRYTLLPSGTDPVLFADDDLILDASLVQRMLHAHAMSPSRVIGADCRCADATGAYMRPTSNQAEVRPRLPPAPVHASGGRALHWGRRTVAASPGPLLVPQEALVPLRGRRAEVQEELVPRGARRTLVKDLVE